ncbi:MAG: OmpA family protein [Microscillaceae bacterium]|nr:OmpA family protein [Microscillaceae bacterium]
MKFTNFSLILSFILCIMIFSTNKIQAQKNNRSAIHTDDLDGDGVKDLSGQDKCPTTLSQIEGRRATIVDEISGEEIIIWLPDNLKDFILNDKLPLQDERTQLLNEQAKIKREKKRLLERYGAYADMKSKDRDVKEKELDEEINSFQVKIDSLQKQIFALDPSSYVEFTGNLLNAEGKVIREKQRVKIRIKVDAFGCLPDDDQDGSPNMVDLCPDEIGTVESSGCPDRDKDRIPDKIDDCPDQPGTREMNGCPDRDKDGISDKNDACPDIPGIKELDGCPDKDGDGITDKEDKCPDLPGPKETQGCPDRDGDTVLDGQDDCPDVPGPVANKGCPDILNKASRVLFETGKDLIKPESFPLLDELVALLKEYDDSYIYLEGHTDNEGTDEDNMTLSQNRAKSVKEYLVNKGIAETRVYTNGHGESRPIADNATAAGKTKNRRVEMKLSNQKEFLEEIIKKQ